MLLAATFCESLSPIKKAYIILRNMICMTMKASKGAQLNKWIVAF